VFAASSRSKFLITPFFKHVRTCRYELASRAYASRRWPTSCNSSDSASRYWTCPTGSFAHPGISPSSVLLDAKASTRNTSERKGSVSSSRRSDPYDKADTSGAGEQYRVMSWANRRNTHLALYQSPDCRLFERNAEVEHRSVDECTGGDKRPTRLTCGFVNRSMQCG
jgi:hypothetical protein